MAGLSNEEIAARIVGTYFKEVARLGFKRQLSLDETMNAYYYVLSKLGNPKECIEEARRKALFDEKRLASETKEQAIPSLANSIEAVQKAESAGSTKAAEKAEKEAH